MHSMTAFARQEQHGDQGVLVWEMRSVNHRFLDMVFRLPDEFRVLELPMRQLLTTRLKRGKVECILRYRPNCDLDTTLSVDADFAQHLIQAGDKINTMLANPSPINALDVLKWPGVLRPIDPDLQQVGVQAMSLLDTTLGEFVETRMREGERLKIVLKKRAGAIQDIVNQVRQFLPAILTRQREKLLARCEELNVELDQSRLEQELVLMAQKMDVAEEVDRIESHIVEILRLLESKEPVGRRLDFLMQELNREANTLGSKSVDMASTRAAVDLKVFIEQMREQIQNIE